MPLKLYSKSDSPKPKHSENHTLLHLKFKKHIKGYHTKPENSKNAHATDIMYLDCHSVTY